MPASVSVLTGIIPSAVTLQPGTRLGPYEVLSALGAGGMGEVYKARDTRLDRTVAVKILPQMLAADPQFRERFDREARAISQLDHPHICALYDVGTQAGMAYLVMQYLEGETLADRLARGALPLDQALKTAIEIAWAMGRAHRAGIVHRDLKPGNIMLTTSGAKLLDFGLAKSGAPVVAGAGLSMLPTRASNLTAQGTILGTFQYMAPEQLEGQEADARTDIFAFGAVLYEMLTGRKAFEGKSQASLIGAILKDSAPAVSTAAPLTPPLLDHIVHTCLAKEQDARWQAVTDVQRQLEWVVSHGGIATTQTLSRASPRIVAGFGLAAIAFVAAGVGLATLAGVSQRRPRPPSSSRCCRPLTQPSLRSVPSAHRTLRSRPTANASRSSCRVRVGYRRCGSVPCGPQSLRNCLEPTMRPARSGRRMARPWASSHGAS
jgi:eukaryotic-like serine/threonine-protein kinase